MIYVALLRGINVGGNNRVPMAWLRDAALEIGWTNPSTYIASGNLVFEAPRTSAVTLAGRLEDAIEGGLGFRPRVLVLTATAARKVAAAIPERWANDTDQKCDVVYLLDSVSASAALDQLTAREGIDHVRTAPGALIWRVKRSDATRSGLHKIVGTPLYAQSTIRNVNTARRLAELVNP